MHAQTFLAATLALCLIGATAARSGSDAHDHDHAGHGAEGHATERHDFADDPDSHVSQAHGLRAVHAWTRATRDDEALVFVEIENRSGKVATLLGAQAQVAERASLVGFRLRDGQPDHAPIDSLPLEPGAEIDLAPFGLAFRLEALAGPLSQGESFPLDILTDVGALRVEVAVEAADARRHSHAGHAHD